MRRYLYILLMFLSSTTWAQYKITGKVYDADDKIPLESATVFLNNTTYGTKIDSKGMFTVYNVQNGQYELIASMVGYQTYNTKLAVNGDTQAPVIYLKKKNNTLKEVKIKAAPNQPKYIDDFKEEILGRTPFGKQCNILTPKVIYVNYDRNERKLIASTSDFLIVENNALGYRLKYLVDNFEKDEKNFLLTYVGYLQFEEMKGDSSHQRQWAKNRLEAYTGSLQHFLRSVLANDVNHKDSVGFIISKMNRAPNPLGPDDSTVEANVKYYKGHSITKEGKDSLYKWSYLQNLPRHMQITDTVLLDVKKFIHPTNSKGTYALEIADSNMFKTWEWIKIRNAKGLLHYNYGSGYDTTKYTTALYVAFKNQATDRKGNVKKVAGKGGAATDLGPLKSWENILFTTERYALFGLNGVLVDPLSLKTEGNWSYKRLGDLVPIDYQPYSGEAVVAHN